MTKKKQGKTYRLKTYGLLETEDYTFKNFSKAFEYAKKWLDRGSIRAYEIFGDRKAPLVRDGDFRKKCLDWDRVEERYNKI